MGPLFGYLDYEQQELAIAGYLSGDKKLIEAYNSGCGYMQTAKWLGMVPEYATKETHPKKGDALRFILCIEYGAGPSTFPKI